jgi:hypothetical protein
MTEKETQKDQKTSDVTKKDEVEFEDLLLRQRAKRAIKNGTWSEVELKDVQVYQGYEFVNKHVMKTTSNFDIKGAISGTDNPRDILQDIRYENCESYEEKSDSFRDIDGTFRYNSEEYAYRERKWIIITVQSKDKTYEEDYLVTRTPKFESSSLESVYKSIVSDLGSLGSIGKPADSSGSYLRTDEVMNSDKKDMIFRSLFRLGLLGSSMMLGLFSTILFAMMTQNFFLGLLFMSFIIFALSNIQQYIYDQWYEIAELEWINDIPESAQITQDVVDNVDTENLNIKDKYNFMRTSASVDTYDDGTVVVNGPTGTWSFEGNDGLPADEAIEIYESSGMIDISDVDELPIKIDDKDPRIPVNENMYVSDDGEKVMKVDGI